MTVGGCSGGGDDRLGAGEHVTNGGVDGRLQRVGEHHNGCDEEGGNRDAYAREDVFSFGGAQIGARHRVQCGCHGLSTFQLCHCAEDGVVGGFDHFAGNHAVLDEDHAVRVGGGVCVVGDHEDGLCVVGCGGT